MKKEDIIIAKVRQMGSAIYNMPHSFVKEHAMSLPIGSPDLCKGSRVKLKTIEKFRDIKFGNIRCQVCEKDFNILPRKKGLRFPKHLRKFYQEDKERRAIL